MTGKVTGKDPLDGITLETLLTRLQAHYGWEALGQLIPIRCFTHNPSIRSSLTFLRRTPWARAKVEQRYRALVTADHWTPEN
jgi:uncharacterized protein (DUF2132 family)